MLEQLPLFGKVCGYGRGMLETINLQSFEEDTTITPNPLSMIEQAGVRNSLHKLTTDPKTMISPYRL